MAEKARSQGTLDGLSRRLWECMIPGNPQDLAWIDELSIEQFEVFCRNRAGLIVGGIREIVGDSLRSRRLTDDEIAENSDI